MAPSTVARQLSYSGATKGRPPLAPPSPLRAAKPVGTGPGAEGTPAFSSLSPHIATKPTLRDRLSGEAGRSASSPPGAASATAAPAPQAVHNTPLSPASLRSRLQGDRPPPPLKSLADHRASARKKDAEALSESLPAHAEGAAGVGGTWDAILHRLETTNKRLESSLAGGAQGAQASGGDGALLKPVLPVAPRAAPRPLPTDGAEGDEVALDNSAGWVWSETAAAGVRASDRLPPEPCEPPAGLLEPREPQTGQVPSPGGAPVGFRTPGGRPDEIAGLVHDTCSDLEAAGLRTVARNVRQGMLEAGRGEGGLPPSSTRPWVESPAADLEAAGLHTVARNLRQGLESAWGGAARPASSVRARLRFLDDGDSGESVLAPSVQDRASVAQLQDLEVSDTTRRVERALDEMTARLAGLVSPGANPRVLGRAPRRASPAPATGRDRGSESMPPPREPPRGSQTAASRPIPSAPQVPRSASSKSPPPAVGGASQRVGGLGSWEEEERRMRDRLRQIGEEASSITARCLSAVGPA